MIQENAQIWFKAQDRSFRFFHFSSKHELGLAVVDHHFDRMKREMLDCILGSNLPPNAKFNLMLEWVLRNHSSTEAKCGCFFGNLTIEMSEHDEDFRKRLDVVFRIWIEKLQPVIAEMIEDGLPADRKEVEKLAQGVVAMLEGGILLMKSRQDLEVLRNAIALARGLVKFKGL